MENRNRKINDYSEEDIFASTTSTQKINETITKPVSQTGVTLELDKTALAKALNKILNEVKKLPMEKVINQKQGLDRKFAITITDNNGNDYRLCYSYLTPQNSKKSLLILEDIYENGGNLNVSFGIKANTLVNDELTNDIAASIMQRIGEKSKRFSIDIEKRGVHEMSESGKYENTYADETFVRALDDRKKTILSNLKPAKQNIFNHSKSEANSKPQTSDHKSFVAETLYVTPHELASVLKAISNKANGECIIQIKLGDDTLKLTLNKNQPTLTALEKTTKGLSSNLDISSAKLGFTDRFKSKEEKLFLQIASAILDVSSTVSEKKEIKIEFINHDHNLHAIAIDSSLFNKPVESISLKKGVQLPGIELPVDEPKRNSLKNNT